MIAIVRRIARFDGRSAFSTWSYRVTTNACLDELRRRRRRPVPADGDVPVVSGDDRPALDHRIVDRLTLDQALGALPPEFRAAVVLRDVQGLDYADIAEVLGIPPGTVRSRINRGRAALARALAGDGNPPTP